MPDIFLKKTSESGQALLIVVLVMVIALTVGLSVASRSVTNLRTTAEEESSQKAFSAAEAGIEQALKTGKSITSSQSLGTSARIENIVVAQVGGTEFLLNGGNTVSLDDGIDIWLSNYPDYSNPWPPGASDGSITFYWGSPTDSCNTSQDQNTMSALEIIIISGTPAFPKSTRYAFDSSLGACSTRASNNNFTPSQSGNFSISGKTFVNRASIPVVSRSGLLGRVIPLYASTSMAVVACDAGNANCNPLPPQGNNIDSTGVSGETKRRIKVFQGYPSLPTEFLPYILFQTKS